MHPMSPHTSNFTWIAHQVPSLRIMLARWTADTALGEPIDPDALLALLAIADAALSLHEHMYESRYDESPALFVRAAELIAAEHRAWGGLATIAEEARG